MEVVQKAGRQSADNPFTFVLSDESVDRMGDVIRAGGWDLAAFKKNPVALFGHDHSQVIGIWEDVKVVGKQLLGTLKLAAPGTSELVDTVGKLIEQGILKAVSVGFQPIEAKPRKSGEGYDYTKASLHEVSVVAVPANPQALRKSFEVINPEIASILFAQPGTTEGDTSGQSTHSIKTPNLEAARTRLKAMGID